MILCSCCFSKDDVIWYGGYSLCPNCYAEFIEIGGSVTEHIQNFVMKKIKERLGVTKLGIEQEEKERK